MSNQNTRVGVLLFDPPPEFKILKELKIENNKLKEQINRLEYRLNKFEQVINLLLQDYPDIQFLKESDKK